MVGTGLGVQGDPRGLRAQLGWWAQAWECRVTPGDSGHTWDGGHRPGSAEQPPGGSGHTRGDGGYTPGSLSFDPWVSSLSSWSLFCYMTFFSLMVKEQSLQGKRCEGLHPGLKCAAPRNCGKVEDTWPLPVQGEAAGTASCHARWRAPREKRPPRLIVRLTPPRSLKIKCILITVIVETAHGSNEAIQTVRLPSPPLLFRVCGPRPAPPDPAAAWLSSHREPPGPGSQPSQAPVASLLCDARGFLHLLLLLGC
ncbi:tubulin polymerization-promoting protein isoform X2 [Symphalangus syndactylus]|uniref:tubulin polymerization-promoting protein isoform X2 n=1 Tax=Symphalangus syndactylus TaxID=9590 RepID=UPI003005ECDD